MRKTCLDQVYELAKRDPRVVFVGSDLGPDTLAEMRDEMPDRFFMEGVTEANIIGMAAGLAMEGYIPYVNTIATFITRRCYEQVAIDLCLHNLPVRTIGNGGGLVYAPLGPTHLAIDDIALMRTLPNMTVVAPTDAQEMKRFMAQTLDWPGPIYIRLGKGGDPIVSRDEDGFAIGKAIAMREGADVLIVATGVMVERVMKAAGHLAGQGIGCAVLNMHTLKPFDADSVLRHAQGRKLIVSVEEHLAAGGLGSALADLVSTDLNTVRPPLLRLALPDEFTHDYGSQDSLLESYGLQGPQIAASIASALARVG
jgi:transketolase